MSIRRSGLSAFASEDLVKIFKALLNGFAEIHNLLHFFPLDRVAVHDAIHDRDVLEKKFRTMLVVPWPDVRIELQDCGVDGTHQVGKVRLQAFAVFGDCPELGNARLDQLGFVGLSRHEESDLPMGVSNRLRVRFFTLCQNSS